MSQPFDAVHSLANNWGMGLEDRIPQSWFNEIKPEINILEVGFGKGNLLKKLESTNAKLYGIECSQTNYRYAQNELKVKANISLLDISFERFPYPDGHFQIVILCEVLEHVLSPMHVILEIQRTLQKNGLFIYSWPEERLISGIGLEEDQSKRRHDLGYHTFPYPGLFRYDNMRVFFNQMFFKIIDEEKLDYHIFFKMLNIKPNRVHILDVVNGDYDKKQLYCDIETEPKYKELIPFKTL